MGTITVNDQINYTEPDAGPSVVMRPIHTISLSNKGECTCLGERFRYYESWSKLTATASGASTYQWYKKIRFHAACCCTWCDISTYTLQPSDIGYEFNVDVGDSRYATMSSGYTKAVTSVKPSGIDTSISRSSSVDAMAKEHRWCRI